MDEEELSLEASDEQLLAEDVESTLGRIADLATLSSSKEPSALWISMSGDESWVGGAPAGGALTTSMARDPDDPHHHRHLKANTRPLVVAGNPVMLDSVLYVKCRILAQ